jgi:hypothetical protein
MQQVIERIRVPLGDKEYSALCVLADRELRAVPDQIRAIIREQLRREGLLKDENKSQSRLSSGGS